MAAGRPATVAVFVGLVFVMLWAQTESISQRIKDLIFFLAAMTAVHLIERLFIEGELDRRTKEALRAILRQSSDLAQAAQKCGLEAIYPSRESVREEIIQRLKEMPDLKQHRIWLLGIAFAEDLHLSELLEILKGKANVDVRILLLDALRSTAVFRSFLESSSGEIQKMLAPRTDRDAHNHPYYWSELYKVFDDSLTTLKKYPGLRGCTRYYGHNPTCWAVIIDNEIYYRPYLFGNDGERRTDNLRIGPLMPVLKFNADQHARASKILIDHFDKVWRTSDTDALYAEARRAERHKILTQLFSARDQWLRHVHSALWAPKAFVPTGKDERRHPRQLCTTSQGVTITWHSSDGESPRALSGSVQNWAEHLNQANGLPYSYKVVRNDGQFEPTIAIQRQPAQRD